MATPKITVDPVKLDTEINALNKAIETYLSFWQTVNNGLGAMMNGMDPVLQRNIGSKMDSVMKTTRICSQTLMAMRDALNNCKRTYESIDVYLAKQYSDWLPKYLQRSYAFAEMSEEEQRQQISNNKVIYGGKGFYGGNQSSARERWEDGDREDIKRIILQHYPNMSDSECQKLLSEMGNEGCNYMAWVNTVFNQYYGREEDFYKRFGFPMYDQYGHPNFDLMMVDLYCSEGGYNGRKEGLSKVTSETIIENYLNGKGINVDVVNVAVSPDNYDNLSKDGEIILRITGSVQYYDAKGNRSGYGVNLSGKHFFGSEDRIKYEVYGHSVTITGVEVINGKKMYKVSTWGLERYIDPKDKGLLDIGPRGLEYQQIKFR